MWVLRLKLRLSYLAVNAFIATEHLAGLESIYACVLRGAVWACPITGVIRITYCSLIDFIPLIKAKNSQVSENSRLCPLSPPFVSTKATILISMGKDAVVGTEDGEFGCSQVG